VQNFAPALQKVVVEALQVDGSWRALHSRHTIEFRAEAAQPHANITHPFSVPVDSAADVLRISVHGLGQVAIQDVVLSNGVTVLKVQGLKKRTILGRKAPRSGFPDPAAPPVDGAELTLGFRAVR
jgi:hypothetical protein